MTGWQISESGASVALDDRGRGTVTFTVTNPGPDPDRVVLTITPLDGAERQWFVVDEPQRRVEPGDSVVYVVEVEIPEGAPPGTYGFQAVAYSADRDPGESSVTSKRVIFEVGAPEKAAPFPWWAVAVAVAVVVVIAGVFWLLAGDDPSTDDGNDGPPATATTDTIEPPTDTIEPPTDTVPPTIPPEFTNPSRPLDPDRPDTLVP